MSIPMEISICTDQDYAQILDELHEFWGPRDTHHLHHPFLVHEFGNSAFVIRNGGEVVAYLFGFLSQTEPVGYVHTLAVRTSARRRRGTVASTSKRSPRRQIWSPSHFTKASACSSSASPTAMEFRLSPTMPAAARRAWSFGRRSRRTLVTSRRIGGRLHLVVGLRPSVSLLNFQGRLAWKRQAGSSDPSAGPSAPDGPTPL